MNNKPKLTIPQMMEKLDGLYEQEEQMKKQMIILQKQYIQLQEDKQMLQNLIMYTSNKNNRGFK